MQQSEFTVSTSGRGTIEITREVDEIVHRSSIQSGLCHVFVQHTSASLILCENADPSVRRDLETIFARLAPDGDPHYVHTAEGDDDMAAHGRSILTNAGITLPLRRGRLALGTWQGLYLWEHRTAPHRRRLVVTILD